MPRDINKRLSQLRIRRSGIDRMSALDSATQTDLLNRYKLEEGWQRRAKEQPYTRYSLGAMSEVDSEYTRISLETAERVGRQLDAGLSAEGFRIEFRLQGSVPLNVHIRGISDVDLLNLDVSFLVYSSDGARSRSGFYSPVDKTSLGVLSALRSASERILKAKFPAAKVDTSGGKAISIAGGSLPRSVDVVPSHWFDTVQYQISGEQRDRAVIILDKNVQKTISNWPFLHIHRINVHDQVASGGLKKAIRLCKNVKSDANDEGKNIIFPSFDIAATMYHSDLRALSRTIYYELSVLAETQRFLDELYHDKAKAMSLSVPDGSRRIFDSEEKYQGLRQLSIEIDDLAKEVAREQNILLRADPNFSLGAARDALANAFIL